MKDEVWVKIFHPFGEETKYEVSNYGKVRNAKTNYELSISVNKNGYPSVTLYHKGQKCLCVHQLVKWNFDGVPENYGHGKSNYVIDHIDKNKLNNNIDNLQYITLAENFSRSVNGEQQNSNILNQEQVTYIWENRAEKSQRAFAKDYGVSQATIWAIFNGKSWNSVTGLNKKER